ncbi:hypothetical protein WA026_001719 [Henosepilachna vigintioctopunctata]|uniref:Uncharacterized protein n=1 Tax=Henosepilachna vigintioctopunctata TaxID=420089 RepID=A0AAW1UVE6_9CUCU
MKQRNKSAVNVVKRKLSRKQLRKEKRTEKKVRKNEYYSKRQKFAVISKQSDQNVNTIEEPITQVHSSNNVEQLVRKEQKKQKKLQKEMTSQRNKQLKLANEDEDRNIKKLEQQLKLNKRKSKTVPKSFSEDGLDFLLELCDPDKMNSAIAAEQQFADVNDDFAEDLALMTGKESKPKKKRI